MSRPPLPPATRIEPPPVPHRFHHEPEPHSLPGWVAALIYLACLTVLGWAIFDRMLPGAFG